MRGFRFATVGQRWRLRTGLLAPIVLLVPLVLAATALSWEAVTRREAEGLVAQRQATALAGLNARLKERQQANETISYLLAKRDTVETAMETGNVLRVAQTLVLMQATLDLSYINVYGSNGARLLQLGGSGAERIDGPLVASAILGHNGSAVAVGENGLVVAAAATVNGRSGTTGVIVVGSALAATVLGDGPTGEDVAVFRSGHLVDTSLANRALLVGLEEPVARGELDGLNLALPPALHLRAAGTQVDADGVLVALVPIYDLEQASQERARLVIGGTLALLLTLILTATIQTRAIARPLDNLVGVAGALVRGDYRRRVAPTGNLELQQLGLAVNHLAGELERKVAELTRQATHDPLSGLPNRLDFVAAVEAALSANAPTDAVAVLFLDLDNFKIVNDSLGHVAGDRLIVAVAERLRGVLLAGPSGPSIARLGGDEFTLLMPHAGDGTPAIDLAECLLAELAAPFHIDDHELFISGSIGIALSTSGPGAAGDLLRAADVAMYRAKNSGRGQCVLYDGTMGRHAADRLELETELRRAIERGSLTVYYQPIVDLATGRLAELEALVRWDHPQRGLMPPSAFIPLAEETGLIVPLGRWVLEQACRQTRAWQVLHPADPPLMVSVNLSARQLQQPDLAARVSHILQASGLSPSNLKLEITESVLMRDADAARVAALAALGIHLAIDDFGTGYSSLAYLSRLPIDTLKIDRSFVSRLGVEPESAAVVRTIVALAHTLNLSVTAEGIERPEQAARLRSLGCQYGQGYLFARPAPADRISIGAQQFVPAA